MEVTSTEIQNNFGTYLKLAQIEDVYVTRNGKRIAVLKYWVDPGEELSNSAENKVSYRDDNRRMSYEEFLKLSSNSDKRYEFIDGEVFQLASPSYGHQRIIVELLNSFYQWSQGKKCRPITAPFDVTILKNESPNVVQPDIVVICDPENIDEQGGYNGTPQVVVEVLSETTRNHDLLRKLNLYMTGGVKEYWIVNPWNREIYIYSFEPGAIRNYRVFKGAETAGSETLEGLTVSLAQVFA